MPRLILAPAVAPGTLAEAAELTLELTLILDEHGQPDPAAWQADPAPWPARRLAPDVPPIEGDVHHDPDYGWSLRFFPAAGAAPDAPLHTLVQPAGPLRPGETLTIRAPDGTEMAWRIVGLA